MPTDVRPYNRDVIIRAFEDEDWPHVWPIIREVVRAKDTFTYDPEMTEEQARADWIAPAGGLGLTVVAEDEGKILGTAEMDRNRPGPGAHVSTASFMVAADARGRGVGRALVGYALDWGRKRGYAGMQFNAVAASNVHAVHLYESLGFRIVGTVPGAFEHPTLGRVGLHVMYHDFAAD